jgi:hypothetical protein
MIGLPSDWLGLRLFDFKTQKWAILTNTAAAYPTWSRDGQYVYFLQQGLQGLARLGIRDRKVEQVVDLKGGLTRIALFASLISSGGCRSP